MRSRFPQCDATVLLLERNLVCLTLEDETVRLSRNVGTNYQLAPRDIREQRRPKLQSGEISRKIRFDLMWGKRS